VITDSGAEKPAIPVIPDSPNPENLSNKGKAKAETSKPANEVITDPEVVTGVNSPQRDEVGAASGPEASREPGKHSTGADHSPRASACEPYREAIELGLSRGRNARAIWQDLVCECGFASSYQSVQRFMRKRRGAQVPEARVVIVTAPGQEAQVDCGTGPMVRNPESRKYRRTRLFVMTLGCSRKSVRLLTFRSSSRIWAELHERAFRRLGGATRIVVLDNLREGVLVPDIYDPALNPLYTGP
jgi:transposase